MAYIQSIPSLYLDYLKAIKGELALTSLRWDKYRQYLIWLQKHLRKLYDEEDDYYYYLLSGVISGT